MKLNKTFMAVILAAIFLCSNIFNVVYANPSDLTANDDYRDKIFYDTYGNVKVKPIAKFAITRSRNGEEKSRVESYSGVDYYEPFPVLDCYVGDTITFEDLSKENNGGKIRGWDWQYYGQIDNFNRIFDGNPLETSNFTLTDVGETTFFLCVKSNIQPKYGTCDPWSDNGNHQTIGKNKYFPKGMYWYFTAITVVVHPAREAKVTVKYWNAQENTVFHEGVVNAGELFGDDATLSTNIHITDWDGCVYQGWNVVLPDGTIQYSGAERDVGITLASWLPEKTLNVDFIPIKDTQVIIRYWDTQANRIMHEETKQGEKVSGDQETQIPVHIIDWDGYNYQGWNVMLPDGTIQYSGNARDLNITLSGYIPFKYLNIEYSPKGGGNTPTPTPTNPPPNITPPPKPAGTCDGVITWSESASHRVLTGYDKYGRAQYKTCTHILGYKAVLTATCTTTPKTLKSGYGFEVTVDTSVSTVMTSHSGCGSWGDNRASSKTISLPTKATVYLPWRVSNRLGTQDYSISLERSSSSGSTVRFITPISPISEAGARRIYTDVSLPGTKDSPQVHNFEIFVSGGGVGTIEFCNKLQDSITINGDMYEDDFSGAN